MFKDIFNIDRHLQGFTDVLLDATGNGFDPTGSRLPAFRARTPPSIEVPRKAPKKTADISEAGMYTDEEINAMSDVQFAIKVGGARTKQQFFQQRSKTQGKAIIVDEFDSVDDHGITPREHGEMRAYTPTLTDLELAGKVKRGRAAGKTLRQIAKDTGKDYQLIRHYSAALGRAQTD